MIVSPLVTNREKNPFHKPTFRWGAKLLDGYFGGNSAAGELSISVAPDPDRWGVVGCPVTAPKRTSVGDREHSGCVVDRGRRVVRSHGLVARGYRLAARGYRLVARVRSWAAGCWTTLGCYFFSKRPNGTYRYQGEEEVFHGISFLTCGQLRPSAIVSSGT